MELNELATALARQGKIYFLTCAKCTVEENFQGRTQDEAMDLATDAGWVKRGDQVICPKCPAVRLELKRERKQQ